MKISQRILQRCCSQKNFRDSFGDIEEILGAFCAMENIPEIMRFINDQQTPFYFRETFDQLRRIIIGSQNYANFVFVFKVVFNCQIISFDGISISDGRFKAKLF